MSETSIWLLTTPGCGLCVDAQPLLERAATRLGVDLIVIDISDDAERSAKFRFRVPVVVDANDRPLAEGRIGAISAWWAVARVRLSARAGGARS